ncbi:hypothetical protein K474DRAFT_373267 [Panus rudis PR-1116 ss-1]|nr:hypothetical protein K474DRAFT_373267 [Panus rudis PR-1116 ss-1]
MLVLVLGSIRMLPFFLSLQVLYTLVTSYTVIIHHLQLALYTSETTFSYFRASEYTFLLPTTLTHTSSTPTLTLTHYPHLSFNTPARSSLSLSRLSLPSSLCRSAQCSIMCVHICSWFACNESVWFGFKVIKSQMKPAGERCLVATGQKRVWVCIDVDVDHYSSSPAGRLDLEFLEFQTLIPRPGGLSLIHANFTSEDMDAEAKNL